MSVVGEANRVEKEGFPRVVDAGNAGFPGHKDIWQNPQGKEESNKPNSATVLQSAPAGRKGILARARSQPKK